MRDVLRLAVGTLTAVPVAPPGRVDRRTAGWAMSLAPVVGLALGLPVVALWWALGPQSPPLLAAALAIALLALLTRGLHLDGLADTADGLSAGYDAASSLRAMKASDTGPSGVAAVVLALLLQATSLAALLPSTWGTALAVAAWLASRHSVAWACRRGVPAAQDTGLGALVADSVGRAALGLAAAAVTACSVALGVVARVAANSVAAQGGSPRGLPVGVVGVVAVLVVALASAHLLVRRCRHRLGGVTGDVLGAGIEVALTTGLVTAALLVSL